MNRCEVCGNEKRFDVIVEGESHVFDSFECAIQALAPVCPNCDVRIIGHGVDAGGEIYCSESCARDGGA
jgi:hypothetical protein